MAGKYRYEVKHSGLNKYRIVTGETNSEAKMKADALLKQWNDQWTRQIAQEEKKAERMAKKDSDEESTRHANELTKEAENMQMLMDNILIDSLRTEPFQLTMLKDSTAFSVKQPREPEYHQLPEEPKPTDMQFNRKAPISVKFSKKKMEQFELEQKTRFEEIHDDWTKNTQRLNQENEKLKNEYDKIKKNWENDKFTFYKLQEAENANVDRFYEDVNKGKKAAIEKYFNLLFENIAYPFDYERNTAAEYFNNEKLLLIETTLPVISDICNCKAVTYIKSKGEYKETYYPESYLKSKYENVVYQIVLQTLYYCFHAKETMNYIDSVVLNGRISTIDTSTGNSIEPCILTVNVKRSDFEKLRLTEIVPRDWFKSAKGISAASLAHITPVAPIMKISREDKRFVDPYEVIDSITEGDNIAIMDWKDFENLIREIFEKEFNNYGGEVKITQASRDGGVDAIAFDPDPIRGGKIVIQAKRYTNTVGVSAVRDLYGTVMNEGANKGILVTTSNYGNDAYAFANGKPLTLINGANLLSMLEKYGYNARIDLVEAKKILNE